MITSGHPATNVAYLDVTQRFRKSRVIKLLSRTGIGLALRERIMS
ncbi:MAG TPA: hypothetical protein VFT02_15110 [Pyrinomonadaceae bacterium]|nr:hypothetical protein [Pyrinomonadaceae bacterium]